MSLCVRKAREANIRPTVRVLLLATIASNLFGTSAWARPSDDHFDSGACLAHRHAADPAPNARARATIDAATGRDLLNYPPHPLATYKHLRLDLFIRDMNTPSMAGLATYTLSPIGDALDELTLNAPLMAIRSVNVGGISAKFAARDGQLIITCDPPIPAGAESTIQIAYEVSDPPEGLIWTPQSAAWPNRPAQVHTQGQPSSNRFWFPCHDFPNVRMSTELVATVPKGFTVIGNGRLVSDGADGSTANSPLASTAALGGYQTWQYSQAGDHPAYLVSMIVGQFDAIDLGTPELPMPVYGPPGSADRMKITFARTPRMVEVFEQLTGEKYPWEKYAQTIVHNFAAGGMENTSATTLYDTAVLDQTALLDGDLDGLIAHELAHQWFGDLITCKSWEHIWLNEGFATYFDALWHERRDAMGADRYQWKMLESFARLEAVDLADAPYQPAMVSKEYTHPWETFRRAANPYPKGSWTLHMLRQRLGDDLFFKTIATYVDRFKHKPVETGDFRRVVEEVTGLSLQRFFTQWTYRPGIPKVRVTHSWNSASGEFTVNLSQTQTINADNPAFALEVPVWVRVGEDRSWRKLVASTDAREATTRFALPSVPLAITVDPEMSMLAAYDVDLSGPMARELATNGPTLAAKVMGIRQSRVLLSSAGGSESDSTRALLVAIARDKRAFFALGIAAAESLGNAKDWEGLAALLNEPPPDARVRKAVADAVGKLGDDHASMREAAAALVKWVQQDQSYDTRAAALKSLGKLKATESVSAIMAALPTPSQHDRIRQGALEALGSLGQGQAITLVRQYAGEAYGQRTRATAILALGQLWGSDADGVISSLASMLTDRDARVRSSAAEALALINDPRATSALESAQGAARGDNWTWDLQRRIVQSRKLVKPAQ